MATRPYIPNPNLDNSNMQRPGAEGQRQQERLQKAKQRQLTTANADKIKAAEYAKYKAAYKPPTRSPIRDTYRPSWASTSGGSTSGGSTSDPYKQFETAQTKANAANEARYKEGLGKYQQVEGIYGPKGTFGAGQEAAINAQKQKDVAAGTQSLVGAGMGNTTVAASLPQAWESNVGSQARLNLADTKAQGYAGALGNTAGFIERRTDQAPDMGQYAGLVQQANTPYDTGMQGGQPQSPTYQPQPAVNQAAQTYADTIRSAAQAKNLNNPNMRYPSTPLQPNRSMPQQNNAVRPNPVQQPIKQPVSGGGLSSGRNPNATPQNTPKPQDGKDYTWDKWNGRWIPKGAISTF